MCAPHSRRIAEKGALVVGGDIGVFRSAVEGGDDHLGALLLKMGDAGLNPRTADVIGGVDPHLQTPFRGKQEGLAVAGGGDAQGLQGLAGVGQTGFAIVQGVVVGQGHALHAAQRQNLPVGRRPPGSGRAFRPGTL